jgi:hypothetical protein
MPSCGSLRGPCCEGAADRSSQELRIGTENVMATVMLDDLLPHAPAILGIDHESQ